MAATPRAPGASAAWQRLSCSGASWGIRGVPDTRTDRTDPAACYLVTARTEVSKTAPYRLHTAYLILEKSKSECKIHFSILPVQRKYGRTEIDTEAKMTKSNSGNRRSDDGKNRPEMSHTLPAAPWASLVWRDAYAYTRLPVRSEAVSSCIWVPFL